MFLYIKKHNKTGLKYFGQTHKKDPYKYLGSGINWKRHLQLNGNDVKTVRVWEFQNNIEAKTFALDFSIKNNIVESKEWANMINEGATQGASLGNQNAKGNKGKPKSEEHKKKLSELMKGKLRLDLIGNTFASALKGRKKANEHQIKINLSLNTPEVKAKIKAWRDNQPRVKCPHCDVVGRQGHNMKRYHFDNCKGKN